MPARFDGVRCVRGTHCREVIGAPCGGASGRSSRSRRRREEGPGNALIGHEARTSARRRRDAGRTARPCRRVSCRRISCRGVDPGRSEGRVGPGAPSAWGATARGEAERGRARQGAEGRCAPGTGTRRPGWSEPSQGEHGALTTRTDCATGSGRREARLNGTVQEVRRMETHCPAAAPGLRRLARSNPGRFASDRPAPAATPAFAPAVLAAGDGVSAFETERAGWPRSVQGGPVLAQRAGAHGASGKRLQTVVVYRFESHRSQK